jgi:hypothetical protein
MNLGGPVWHASAAPYPMTLALPMEVLRRYALAALDSVGDARLGEWEEVGRDAYHVRRRLSSQEQQSVGPVVDVRDTPEAARRYARAQRFLPAGVPCL